MFTMLTLLNVVLKSILFILGVVERSNNLAVEGASGGLSHVGHTTRVGRPNKSRGHFVGAESGAVPKVSPTGQQVKGSGTADAPVHEGKDKLFGIANSSCFY